MKIAFHHPTARIGFAIPIIINRQVKLYKVFTDFYSTSNIKKISRLVDTISFKNFNLYSSALKRTCTHLPDEKFVDIGFRGYLYNLYRSMKSNYIEKLKITLKVSELISLKMQAESANFDTVYAFALSGLPCKKFMPGKRLILDQMHIPLSSLIDILEREEKKNSEWFLKSINPYKGCEEFIRNLERKDLSSSDLIFAPSEFVKNTLCEVYNFNNKQIIHNPYPVPAWLYDFETSLTQNKFAEKQYSEKIRILFVGEVGIRKGAHILLQALDKLDSKKYEARLIGSLNISHGKVNKYSQKCIFTGILTKLRLAKQYQWADIFVFPSLGEGSAGAIYEAMAFGLPVITTFSAGSHVRHEVDGFIVPELNVDALVERIEFYMEKKDILQKHAHNSWNRVKEFSWDKTSLRLSSIFEQIS